MSIIDTNLDTLSYMKWFDPEDRLPRPGKMVLIYIPKRKIKVNGIPVRICMASREVIPESEMSEFDTKPYRWIGYASLYYANEVSAWAYIDDTNIPKTSK